MISYSVKSDLSCLRYGPGNYFKQHCDGLNDVSIDGVEYKSFVTLHIYLNDDGLEGGATRFWTPDKKHWLDVHPKLGRVLIFQQRMLIHSGEEVTKGLKYTMRGDILFKQVVDKE
jgi:2OG-Fe(II) oxygenase superfamily